MKIGIVIPTYNEKNNIKKLYDTFKKPMPKNRPPLNKYTSG